MRLHRPIHRLWFFTGQRHDLHELLEREGGFRSWTLLIGQENFDGLTQQFRLACRFDGLQTRLRGAPAITPASHRFVIHLHVPGNAGVAGSLCCFQDDLSSLDQSASRSWCDGPCAAEALVVADSSVSDSLVGRACESSPSSCFALHSITLIPSRAISARLY